MQPKKKNEKPCKCPHCGANMIIHGHRISKGLSKTLLKFKESVIKHDRNMIHIKDEVSFTKSEFTNFQKLRYHGLVAKYLDPITKKHIAGYWLLTKRGNLFCKNMISLPVIVYTFRNKIVQKHEEKTNIMGIMQDDYLPYWDEKEDFPFEFADVMDIEEIQFDVNGQGLLALFNLKDDEDNDFDLDK